MAKPKLLDKNRADISQIFLTYTALVGDAERTALALDLDVEQVKELAASEGWNEKLRRVSLLSKSGKPGDYEKGVNRAISFVQAQCLRSQVDRLLREVSQMSNEELMSRACVRTKDGGNQLSAKFLVDLANAAEACHRMAYNALGDTVTERCEAEGGAGDPGSNANAMHAAIIASLSNPSADPGPITQRLITEANDKAAEIASAIPRAEATVEAQDLDDSAYQ